MQQLDMNFDMGAGEPRRQRILQVLLLLVVACVVLVAGIGGFALTDPEEARYAIISKNMIDHGNYRVPWRGDEPYFDKPPLYFWLTAASIKLFGADRPHAPDRLLQFAVRLVPVFGAVLTVLATYLLAQALFNHVIGLLSAAAILTTVALVGFGKYVRMDIYLTLFLTVAFWAFIQGYKTAGPSRWYLLMYPMIALGILTKGPIALVIWAAVILIFLAWQRRLVVVGHMRLIMGLAIVIALAGPWFLYMQMTHPGYFTKFFIEQNLMRWKDGIFGHLESPLIYLAVLLVGFLPWTGLITLAVARYLRSSRDRAANDWESRFLILWFLFVLAFFSLSATKLVNYILPVFVPGTVLFGRFLFDYWSSDYPRRRREWSFAAVRPVVLVMAVGMVLFCFVAAVGAPWCRFHEHWAGLDTPLSGWARWGWLVSLVYRLAIALVLARIVLFFWRNWQIPQILAGITVAFIVLAIDLSYTELARIADLYSARPLIPMMVKHSGPGDVILTGLDEFWSVPLYLGSRRETGRIHNVNDASEFRKSGLGTLLLTNNEQVYRNAETILPGRVQVLAQYRNQRLLKIHFAK